MLLLNFFPGFALFYFCMREDVDLYKGKNAKICEMYQYVINIRKNEISLLWIDIHFCIYELHQVYYDSSK